MKIDRAEESWIWIQRCLLQAFNHTSGNQLKKWELSVTPEGFFRLRKYFLSGKQEYFSFHLSRLKDINYNGTSQWGDLIFKAIEDDIIVQTYNDPKGNIDSMATILSIPVLDMEPERLDSLRNALIVFKH
ncbi:MAG: hypothetical protein H7Y13_03705 [Sphingobacteriaceae bacterium]|nr:hypothetical protein [Sphingobacteriaceae bacterium]